MTRDHYLSPGTYVRCPNRPEWGLGQVQSVVGERITANFENAGKLVIDIAHVNLIATDAPLSPAPRDPGREPGAGS